MGLKDRLAGVPVLGTALAVHERYVRDAADPLAASIGFFGFLSLFPLLALAVSVAGFVLEDPAQQRAVAAAITESLPGFEATREDSAGGTTAVDELVEGVVTRRGTIGVVGLVTLLIPGLKVVNAAMIATRVVLRGEVMTGIGTKLRQLAALVGLGAIALAAAGASSLAATGIGGLPAPLALLLSMAVTFGLDLALFLGAYTLLSPSAPYTARELLPGAVLAAVGWMALKVAGAGYIGGQMEQANALYGALGGVIGLLLLLYLAGRLFLSGAELSAVRRERRLAASGETSTDTAGADGPAADAANHGQRAQQPRPQAAGTDADDGPPPVPRVARQARPVDPGPGGAAATVSAATRDRVGAADAATAGGSSGRELQRALGIGLGIAALAAAWRWLGPDRQ